MTDNNIQKIKIMSSNDKSIFNMDKYIIPLYQRAFAWESTEIEQMIDDIENFETDNYYLGTLIVFKRNDGKFEVIDGQQRLTALYLLLTVLNINFDDDAVSFEYRQKSDDTLVKLKNTESNDWRLTADEGILSGFDVIYKKINNKNEVIEHLKIQLEKVNLVRVMVPPNTDLNKYFEIMNNRGEQLEQQDIVKSQLIEMIRKESRDAFSRIWDACSDMNGYVQMHFDKSERDHYFNYDWDSFPYEADGYYTTTDKTDRSQWCSIDEIADSLDITALDGDNTDKINDDNIRFESFLTFRHFLLHVLKIFEMQKYWRNYSKNERGSELLDDKKLIQRFKEAFPSKIGAGKEVERFGLCLLQCRFLFDNYMLKREFNGDDAEGKWSLKMLKVSWSNSRKYERLQPKAYYVDVPGGIESRMLQSMLRVTYTSPLVMHWVTNYLAWLYFDMYNDGYDPNKAAEVLESIAKEPVGRYLSESNYSIGLDTLHIVFNYLDYLLWKKSKPEFQFEFRNSVEHWYPQNPIDSNIKWNPEDLNHFGNLCLVSSALNSKFSNNVPLAKKVNFRNGIEKQSLKLRIMADLTSGANAWTEKAAISHGCNMISILKKAVDSG